MNKKLTIELLSFLLIVSLLGLTACMKDNCRQTHTYTYYTAVYETKEVVKTNIKNNAAREVDNPGKIYTIGRYIFLNETDKGVHVIDNSDPSHPNRISFIDIPGNIDIAVKGNTLYADMYADLVAIDITDPINVKLTKTIEGIFPERNWGNGFVWANNNNQVITDWIRHDTTVVENCESMGAKFNGRADVFFSGAAQNNSAGAAASPIGTGGSMARFTIVNDYMYAVDHHTLRYISLKNERDPVNAGEMFAGYDIETIYPFKDKLFLGSMGGMFIYDISNPVNPVQQSTFVHARACDPVIADDDYAYVTLRAGTNCGPTENELQIIDIKNLQSPSLAKKYPMTGPYGLGKDGKLLFICDGKDGLKVYDASDVNNLKLVKTIGGIDTYDVIALNKIALVVAKDGLYQYDYSNASDIELLSKITINK